MVSLPDRTNECLSEEKRLLKQTANRWNVLSTVETFKSIEQASDTMMIEEESTDSSWASTDDSITKSLPVTDFYADSYSSSSSISSFDFPSSNNNYAHVNQPELKIFSSSSGYDSSLTSIPDHLFPSSPNSITIPDCHCLEQFVHLHPDERNSSPSFFAFSSLSSQKPISTINSPSYCRKCVQNNQVSSDTDDDSQSTIILSSQKRPRSLPITIQQSKTTLIPNETKDSSFYPCTNSGKLHINESKNSLEHFIMSPTDRVKIQMKYQEDHTKNNELKITQPEDIDFKRSKLKAIRVLYQNRIQLNSSQSPAGEENSTVLSSRTARVCHSPLAKPTVNPRLFRSVISCSVLEADDEHEVVSSTTRTGVNGTREKSPIETFNCLRINFIESLLHGKILPCGILDGFTVKLGASGLFLPKQVLLPVTTFWFNVSEHQAASPYLGFINLQSLPKRGYHTPLKGTITLALLNPNGTAVHLFFILYDFSDMPADHRTFIRQRVVLLPETTGEQKENLRYLAHIRFVTSRTGKLYLHSDIRLIFARNKLDYDERTGNGKPQLTTITDLPTPKYCPRK